MPSAEAAFVAGGAPLEPDQELLDPSRPNLGALDCEGLRREFHARLIELANDFDSLDHLAGPMGGSELQDDCQRVRDLARALARESKPAAV
jgi:hypothetical protein